MVRNKGGNKSSREPSVDSDAPSQSRAKRHKSTIKYYLRNEDAPTDLPSETPAFHLPHIPNTTASNMYATGMATSVLQNGRQLGSTMVHSLQRRFLSQQTLQTPFEVKCTQAIAEQEDLDGFVLHSQPTYERVLSQHLPNIRDEIPGDDEGAEPEVFSQNTQIVAAAPGRTPGLHSVERIPINIHKSGPRMFPIFRSKKDLKTVYIVRHGESEYNAAISRAGSGWADPLIFDAPLTEKGKKQALALRGRFASLEARSEDVLWVTSPLTRAIETLLLACPRAHMLSCCGGENKHSNNVDEHGVLMQPPTVEIVSSLAEKVFTTGDVGRSPSVLAEVFPGLTQQLMGLPSVWWYSKEGKPNCSQRKVQLSNEPAVSVQRRILEFKRWVLNRPERVIIAVGHSSYWKQFCKLLGDGSCDSMKNCEVRQVYL